MPDYYETLGVSKDSSEIEIKKKYRELSMKHHPDRGGDTAKFQEINQAYETLSDSGKKEQYDMEKNGGGGHPFGRGGHPFGHGGHPFGHGGFPFGQGGPDLDSEIFNMMFGGMGGMRGHPGMMRGGQGIRIFHNGVQVNMGEGGDIFQQMQKPPPIIKNINLTIEQAFHGATIPVEIEKWTIINNNKVNEKELIHIVIPKGVDNGEMIVVRDKGNMINENLKGDIKLIFNIENNSEFIRNGLDIIYKKKISLKEALCGFSFNVKHLNGHQMCLNNSTKRNVIKPNYKKIVPNLGFSKEGNSTGNLIIDFELEFPDSLTEEQMNSLANIL